MNLGWKGVARSSPRKRMRHLSHEMRKAHRKAGSARSFIRNNGVLIGLCDGFRRLKKYVRKTAAKIHHSANESTALLPKQKDMHPR